MNPTRTFRGFVAYFAAPVLLAALAAGPSHSAGTEGSAAARPSTAAAAGKVRQLISAEDFGALPFISDPEMSPNGVRLLATTFVHGKKFLAVLEPSAKGSGIHQSFALPENRDLVWYRWAGNDRILLSMGQGPRCSGKMSTSRA